MTDYRTSQEPQDVDAALRELWDEFDDESYTREREPVQPLRYIDDDRGMIIAAYVTIAACAFILGMVAMRLLTWVWA